MIIISALLAVVLDRGHLRAVPHLDGDDPFMYICMYVCIYIYIYTHIFVIDISFFFCFMYFQLFFFVCYVCLFKGCYLHGDDPVEDKRLESTTKKRTMYSLSGATRALAPTYPCSPCA